MAKVRTGQHGIRAVGEVRRLANESMVVAPGLALQVLKAHDQLHMELSEVRREVDNWRSIAETNAARVAELESMLIATGQQVN